MRSVVNYCFKKVSETDPCKTEKIHVEEKIPSSKKQINSQ